MGRQYYRNEFMYYTTGSCLLLGIDVICDFSSLEKLKKTQPSSGQTQSPGYNVCLPVCILGVPDSPSQCVLQHIVNTTAVIRCYPGYAGGQRVSYVVYKAGILHCAPCYMAVFIRGHIVRFIRLSVCRSCTSTLLVSQKSPKTQS